MLHAFTLYPDELLYSACARYHIWSRNFKSSIKDTVMDLFDANTASAIIEFPCGLSRLVNNLPTGSVSVKELINEHTLFPLFQPFLPSERVEKVINMMAGDNGSGIYTTIGVMPSAIPSNPVLRYCEMCVVEDEEKFGECYWHRSHQVPCVILCAKHGIPLTNSYVAAISRPNKHHFIDIKSQITDSCDREMVMEKHKEHLLAIAQSVQELLEYSWASRGLPDIKERYFNALKARRLTTISGSVRVRELIEVFRHFYGDDLLARLNCSVEYSEADNWIMKLVRKPRTSMHPVRHILMMRFLDMTPNQFFGQVERYHPFGNGPWLCLNPVANHFGKPVVAGCEITRDYKSSVPVGTFSCSCGFVYSRRGPDSSDADKFKVGRIKKFGHVWDKEILRLKNEEKLNQRQIALRMHCDPTTVKKQLKRLEDGSVCDAKEFVVLEDDRVKRRSDWLTLMENNQSRSKTELRSLRPKDYTWLYRYDRQWLDEHSPALQRRIKYADKRVDWQKRDYDLSEKVMAVINEELNGKTKPERVCISAIGKKIRQLAVMQKHIEKLPLTMAVIVAATESIDDFQVRRVKWVAQQMRTKDEILEAWKIVRAAGLKNDYSQRVAEQIENEISLLY